MPAEQPVPLTLKERPVGDEVILACGVKLAMTDAGAPIAIVVEALPEFVTVLPAQLVNEKPALGVACRLTTVPELKNWPEAGVTAPPAVGEAAVVNWYWVLKLAV